MTDRTSEDEEKVSTESGDDARFDATTRDHSPKSQEQKRLATAKQFFETGDYKSVRQLVSELTNSSDPQIVQEARALKHRVSVDPVQIAVIVLCSAVFLAIVITYTLR